MRLRDQSEGNLPTARAASGMEAARTRSTLLRGTWEPVTPMARESRKRWTSASGRVPKRRTGAEQSVVARKVL